MPIFVTLDEDYGCLEIVWRFTTYLGWCTFEHKDIMLTRESQLANLVDLLVHANFDPIFNHYSYLFLSIITDKKMHDNDVIITQKPDGCINKFANDKR